MKKRGPSPVYAPEEAQTTAPRATATGDASTARGFSHRLPSDALQRWAMWAVAPSVPWTAAWPSGQRPPSSSESGQLASPQPGGGGFASVTWQAPPAQA